MTYQITFNEYMIEDIQEALGIAERHYQTNKRKSLLRDCVNLQKYIKQTVESQQE